MNWTRPPSCRLPKSLTASTPDTLSAANSHMAPTAARGAKIPRMILPRRHHHSLVLVLYLCTLLGLLTCGLHQGQMSGQYLSGAGISYCHLSGQHGGVDLGDGSQHQMGDMQPGCPACSSVGHGAALTSQGWTLNYLPFSVVSAQPSGQWARPPPRKVWPAINPRASPSPLDAAHRAV